MAAEDPGTSLPSRAGQPAGFEKDTDEAARNWATLTHLSSFTGYISGIGYIAGPVTMWLLRKDRWEFVDEHGKEAVNFNISLLIFAVASFLLVAVFSAFAGSFGVIAIVIIAVWIAHAIFTIMAAVKANAGESFRYPLSIRFVK